MPNTVIAFTYGNAEYSLNMPYAFTGNTLGKARQLMTYMCKSNDYEHTAAKKTLSILCQEVEDATARCKEAYHLWHEGYRDPDQHYNKKAVEKENKRLKRALDQALREMRKAEKMRDAMTEIYKKYVH